MNNKAAIHWLLLSLLMAATGTVVVSLLLRSAAISWFQTLLSSLQTVAG